MVGREDHRPLELEQAVYTTVASREVRVDVLQKILGYFAWVFLLCRPLYALFGTVYKACHSKDDHEIVRINEGTRKELTLAAVLLRHATVDMRLPLAPVVFASDASGAGEDGMNDNGGYGVCARNISDYHFLGS